jgi:transposase InsO family protein
MLKRKPDVFTVFKQFRYLVEKSTGRSIKCLRTDNGGEFTSMEFENYCKEFGIDRHKTTAYTPQQNGVVECMNYWLWSLIIFLIQRSFTFSHVYTP